MGFIYIITNSINTKVYIGQTIDSLSKRMNSHRSEARRFARGIENPEVRNKRGTCSKLYRAMNKHGIENFKMVPIEEMDNDLLDDAETQYIEEFDSIANGYNLKSGGDRSSHCEETKKIISVQTRIGISRNIDNFRKHNEELDGLPMYCIFVKIKGSDAVAINNHPKCKRKSFTVRKYGSIENARAELLKYLETL